MRKFLVVFAREYVERVRSRWFLVATVIGPLVFGAVGIGQVVLSERAQTSPDVSNIYVLDATGAGLGARVVPRLGGSGALIGGDTSIAQLETVAHSSLAAAESTALRAVMHHQREGYLVLDEHTLLGLSARYDGWNASEFADVERISKAVHDAVLGYRLTRAGLDPAQIASLTNVPLKVEADRITTKGKAGSGFSSAIFGYIVAFVLYMMIVLYGQTIMRGVMEEKQTRVAEVVVASVPSDILLAGKILGVGAVALTQELIWIAASLAIFAERGPLLALFGVFGASAYVLPGITVGAGVVLLLFFVFGFLFYASLFATVGAMVGSPEDAQQAAMPVMLLLVSTVALIVPVLLAPAGGLARTMSWIPFSSPILMPLRMTVVQVPGTDVAVALITLVIACICAIWIASRVYRVGVLMYGKRPTLREVGRWIRQS
jgi:ABC-2 type transport system permease protein